MNPTRHPRLDEFLNSALPGGLALFLGGFCLLNLAGSLRSPRFDANLWWIDLRGLPGPIAKGWLLVSGFALIMVGLQLPRSYWRRLSVAGCVASLAMVCLINAGQFYILAARHKVSTSMPLPLSLLLAAGLLLILTSYLRWNRSPIRAGQFAARLGIIVICCFVFPLMQMVCFGKTDYRRPADVAVVFGARVYADGRPSDALADRVRTACQLYQNGLVRKLIFSGGPGDGSVHETESMRQMALGLGVQGKDILLDLKGLNTLATVKDTEAIFSRLHPTRALVVSHSYHLPRIKLAYQREGIEVYTVPAKETYLLRQMPYNMAREVAALWVYYLKPLIV